MSAPTKPRWDHDLFQAVLRHDLVAIDELIALGADPFAPVAPVELHVLKDNYDVRLGQGCAAAQAIQWPEVLDHLLPSTMNGWPVVTRATDVYGIVSTKGHDVDLGQWAIELSALPSLRLLVNRLDRSHPDSVQSLNRLTMACMAGCSHDNAKDDALNALVICMAACPDLDRGWSHWRHAKLASQNLQHELVFMPLTFVMASIAKKNALLPSCTDEPFLAFSWALMHDEPVQNGDRRMGNVSEDTVLHFGASSGCVKLLRIALNHGCRLDSHDAQGLTPLELARDCGRSDAASFIESWISNKAVERAMREGVTS